MAVKAKPKTPKQKAAAQVAKAQLKTLQEQTRQQTLDISKLETQGRASVDTADAQARSKFLAAIPWVAAALGVAAVVYFAAKARKKRS